MVSIRRSFEAYVDDMNIITVLIPAEQKEIMTPPFRLETEITDFPLAVREEYSLEAKYKYVCVSDHPVTFGKSIASEHPAATKRISKLARSSGRQRLMTNFIMTESWAPFIPRIIPYLKYGRLLQPQLLSSFHTPIKAGAHSK